MQRTTKRSTKDRRQKIRTKVDGLGLVITGTLKGYRDLKKALRLAKRLSGIHSDSISTKILASESGKTKIQENHCQRVLLQKQNSGIKYVENPSKYTKPGLLRQSYNIGGSSMPNY